MITRTTIVNSTLCNMTTVCGLLKCRAILTTLPTMLCQTSVFYLDNLNKLFRLK